MNFDLAIYALLTLLSFVQIISMGRDKFSADFQLIFRLLKALLFLGSVSVIVILHVKDFTVGDLFASILAFLPTGWALLQVSTVFMI